MARVPIPRDPKTADQQATDFLAEAARLEHKAREYRMYAQILKTGKARRERRKKK